MGNMADSQEAASEEAQNTSETTQAEPKKVEVTVAPEEKKPIPAPEPVKVAEPPKVDELSLLTPAIVEALTFNSSSAAEQELRSHSTQLQTLLGKVIELLKDKSSVCSNLEKQNTALMLQTNSLKDVVAITKDLLSIRNMEVDHLHVDIKSMEEKINQERERHNNMLNRMSEAIKLNEGLKAEYQRQLELFNNLRSRYEEKVGLLESENRRLSALVSQHKTESTSEQPPADTATNGDVLLSLDEIPPP